MASSSSAAPLAIPAEGDCVAIADFDATPYGDLYVHLQKGEKVTYQPAPSTQNDGAEWAYGRAGNSYHLGWFPASHVRRTNVTAMRGVPASAVVDPQKELSDFRLQTLWRNCVTCGLSHVWNLPKRSVSRVEKPVQEQVALRVEEQQDAGERVEVQAAEANRLIATADWVVPNHFVILMNQKWFALGIDSLKVYHQTTAGDNISSNVDIAHLHGHITIGYFNPELHPTEVACVNQDASEQLKSMSVDFSFHPNPYVQGQPLDIFTIDITRLSPLDGWIREFVKRCDLSNLSPQLEYHLSLRNKTHPNRR